MRTPTLGTAYNTAKLEHGYLPISVRRVGDIDLMSQSYPSSVTSVNPTVVDVPTTQDKERANEADVEKPQEEAEIPTPNPITPRGWRKVLLVSLLCGAQFFDLFTACSAIAALPTVCLPRLTRVH